jgi:hypothetical protein
MFGLLLDALGEQGYLTKEGSFNMQKAKEDKENYLFWLKLRNLFNALKDELAKIKPKELRRTAKEIDELIEKTMPQKELSQSYIVFIVALEIGVRFNESKCPKYFLLKAELNKIEELNYATIKVLRETAGAKAIRASKIIANVLCDAIEEQKIIEVEARLNYKPSWARVKNNENI